MSTMTRIGRGVAATGVAGLMSLGFATSASADGHLPTGSDANKPEAWEAYLVEEGYVNPMCEKLEDGFKGNTWVSDGDYALVVLKAGSEQSSEGDPNSPFEEVEEGESLTTDDEKDISHIIVCTADMEEEPTPTPSKPGKPSGPVVETDVPVTDDGSTMPAVLGGAAVLAGLGLAAGAMRRKGQH